MVFFRRTYPVLSDESSGLAANSLHVPSHGTIFDFAEMELTANAQ
jgi:hypothetical protein